MRVPVTILTTSLLLTHAVVSANAEAGWSGTDLARDYFFRAVACHNNKDYPCAIDLYTRSYQFAPRPQTVVRLAWVCHERFRTLESSAFEAQSHLQRARQYYAQALQACDSVSMGWENKGEDCDRTRRQWHTLQPALNLSDNSNARLQFPPPGSFAPPPRYMPAPVARDNRTLTIAPSRPAQLDHARNLRIAGMVVGCIGLGGAALGVGLSQMEKQSDLPYAGPYVWNTFDYVALGASGVALLGGVLWLSGKIRQPRSVLARRASYY